MLRCIHCNRPENKVTLSSSFQCLDKLDCVKAIELKNNHPIVVIYFDCACNGRNKTVGTELGVGIATFINDEYSSEYSGSKLIPKGSINTGEFTALIYALSIAAIMKKENTNYKFKIFGDSQFVIYTLNGTYKVGIKFKSYYNKASELKRKLGISLQSIIWIPREQNMVADKLSKEAIHSLFT